MFRTILLLSLLSLSLAGFYGKPKTFSCYVCDYKPPITNTYEVPRQEPYEVTVPVHRKECYDEQVLAGHHVTKVQKTVHSAFEPADDYAGETAEDYHPPAPSHDYKPDSYEHSEPVYKTVKRCVTKVEYTTETNYKTVYDSKTEVIPGEGNEYCVGPIKYHDAAGYGITEDNCSDFCFHRTDAHGNVARGCNGGEVKHSPDDSADFVQGSFTYRICRGSHCNSGT